MGWDWDGIRMFGGIEYLTVLKISTAKEKTAQIYRQNIGTLVHPWWAMFYFLCKKNYSTIQKDAFDYFVRCTK